MIRNVLNCSLNESLIHNRIDSIWTIHKCNLSCYPMESILIFDNFAILKEYSDILLYWTMWHKTLLRPRLRFHWSPTN